MSSEFQRALAATGYISLDGGSVPGLSRRGDSDSSPRLRPVLADARLGLQADAVYLSHDVPTSIFKDSGDFSATESQIRSWHEIAWNIGLAPLLWIITPTEVRLYDCYSSPPRKGTTLQSQQTEPIAAFRLDANQSLRSLDAMCGRFVTETGAFWSSRVGSKIDRRNRVDYELLSEIKALEDRLTLLKPARVRDLHDGDDDTRSARDFAQRLVGRCIFTWYLIDRGIAERFLPQKLPCDLVQIFATTDTAFMLFDWLRRTFNGDLFPMNDRGAERDRLTDEHLALVRDFVSGRSLVEGQLGQGRLFKFRFDAIPVDLIAAIYQQFARSSAADQARRQSLHYTPVELVHLALDPVFENLPGKARIIDPTCGSGTFLVESFRRLVWKRTRGRVAERAIVRDVLYRQLYGIDVNPSALGIAAFSLYLAALELDEEPITDPADLRFERLLGRTLFVADATASDLPKTVLERPFDAVVGNPPWTFVSKANGNAKRRSGDPEAARPRRSPDQAFLETASLIAGDSGRIGMVMKATPFFSNDQHAIDSRNNMLNRLAPAALVNLSALRKEQLFPHATGPALLLLARCELMEKEARLLVGSVPWTRDFRRSGVFHVGPGELKAVPLSRVLRTPAVLKAATFGSVRDMWLIEKLEHAFVRLDDLLTAADIRRDRDRGQGFQVHGDQTPAPKEYYRLKVLRPNGYSAFRLQSFMLEDFEQPTLHRPRKRSIFRGPLLVCPKASYTASAQPGRYSAAVYSQDLLYNESFYGVSFAHSSSQWPHVLSAILNSSLTTFQLTFGGGAWGLERPTVEPNDLLSVRVPELGRVEPTRLRAAIDAERSAAESPHDPKRLEQLDQAVFDLYGLSRDERTIADDSVAKARTLIFEGRSKFLSLAVPPSMRILTDYASEVVRTVNTFLRARGERHLEGLVCPESARQATPTDDAGLATVRFVMTQGAPQEKPIVRTGEQADIDRLMNRLRGSFQTEVPPYLSERRQIRVYGEDELFIVKPAEVRYWTRTAGLNDADLILSDHWLSGRHATVA